MCYRPPPISLTTVAIALGAGRRPCLPRSLDGAGRSCDTGYRRLDTPTPVKVSPASKGTLAQSSWAFSPEPRPWTTHLRRDTVERLVIARVGSIPGQRGSGQGRATSNLCLRPRARRVRGEGIGLLLGGQRLDNHRCHRDGGIASRVPKSDAAQSLVMWATCMRSHGDPNQPDPTIDAHGGINIFIPGSAAASLSNAVHNGTAPCKNGYLATASADLRAGATDLTPPDQDALLRYSQCMRANGVPNYPDPGAGSE